MTRRKPPRPRPRPTPTLADRARELQRLAPVGSTRRKAAGLVLAAAERCRSLEGARAVMSRRRLPPEIRGAVLQLLDELATTTGDDAHA